LKKYLPLHYASIGRIPENTGATGESVEQFGMSFSERQNIFRFLKNLLTTHPTEKVPSLGNIRH